MMEKSEKVRIVKSRSIALALAFICDVPNFNYPTFCCIMGWMPSKQGVCFAS